MPLSFRMIEMFRAVVMQGSISDAAQLLNVSQPAVSRLVRDLEAELGLTLFERRSGRVFATDEALTLFEEVHRSFVGLDRISKAADQIRAGHRGSLSIGCMPAVGLSLMPRVVRRMRKDWPEIDLVLKVFRSPTVIQHLNSLQCDLGVVEASFSSPATQLSQVLQLEMVCVFPPGDPLDALDVVHPADLAGRDFVSLDAESKTRTRIDAIFESAGIDRRLRLEAPLTDVVCSLVFEGCGVSIVDPLSASSAAKYGLRSRPFRPATPFAFQALATARADRTGAFSALCSHIEDALDEMGVSRMA